MRIRTLDTLDEVRTLDGLLEEYIRFVTRDLERASGVSFDPEKLLANTRASLDKVVPPKGGHAGRGRQGRDAPRHGVSPALWT